LSKKEPPKIIKEMPALMISEIKKTHSFTLPGVGRPVLSKKLILNLLSDLSGVNYELKYLVALGSTLRSRPRILN